MFKKSEPENFSNGNLAHSGEPDTVETVVGPSVHVEGDFSSEGNILVKGSVAGNVKTSQLLTVEEGAKISANVKALEAIIAGEITGNVKVEDRIDIKSSARISGDVSCKILAVEAGALISGKIAMKGLDEALSGGITRKKGFGRGKIKEDGTEDIEENSVL
jgi:cytoskeletal protein CcmA (bactofilin family)